MNVSSIQFDRSAPDLASCPAATLPEFAFIGRSNVGKSSLLNLLAGQKELARVSPVPGFTKLINFFTVDKTWRLVDLPGYGFAQVAREDRSKFNVAVANYLEHRPNLCLIFALIDSGLPPQAIDLEFVEWLVGRELPFVIVFTKTDRPAANEAQSNMAAFMERITPWFQQPPATFTCSSKSGRGRAELLAVVDETLRAIKTAAAAEPTAEAPAPAAPEPEPPRKPTDKPWDCGPARGGRTDKARPDARRPW